MSNKVKVCLDAGHVGSKYNQSPVAGLRGRDDPEDHRHKDGRV